MIEAEKLVKRFGRFTAVDGVSFQVSSGQIVGLLGANGAGKSTTMRLLTGYLSADEGTARVGGFDIAANRDAAQRLVGYLPESAGGFPQITVREFLAFAGEARNIWGAELRRAIDRVSEMVELHSAMYRRMSELSKGWRQRAWFAQALLHDPPALILDEPTDGLDPNQKDRARALIRDAAKDKAIILSTHILEEAEELCDRVIVIDHGRVVRDLPCRELLDERGRLAPAFRQLTDGAAEHPGSNP
jgi:ABC-2 type transport system ATP-binding protein